MSDELRRLDECGCCSPAGEPQAVSNAPGLASLAYRVGTFADFRARMLRTLPSARPVEGSAVVPLEKLTVRTTDDPTVALLDAFAQVADILSFYQERIANEGFLRTATERRSVLELARAIGYELAPGVAASAYLSFTVEEAPGAPRLSVIAKGTQVQSVPPQGKLPQIFETQNEFTAFAEWNRLRPRLTRPADMAILAGASASEDKLVLLVPSGSVPAEDVAAANVTVTQVRRLSEEDLGSGSLDAVEVSRIYFTEAAAGLSKGDLLLFAGGTGTDRRTVMLKVAAVATESERKRICVDLEPLSSPATGKTIVPYLFVPILTLAKVSLAPVSFSGANVNASIRSGAWRERDLTAFMGIHSWSASRLVQAVNTPKSAPVAPPQSGAFSFREKVAFFGHNGPKWSALAKGKAAGGVINGDPYPHAWDVNDESSGTPAASRTIWQNSQGVTNRLDAGVDAYLERPVSGIVPSGWVVIGSKSVEHKPWAVHTTTDVSRADFGISGRTTALRLADPATGQELTAEPSTASYRFREAVAFVGSNRLEFSELPIEAPLAADTQEIELELMVLGLAPGQPVMLTGERDDTPGVTAAEVAVLADVIHAQGRTVLVLQTGLQYSYVRESVYISANVVRATHGETVQEVLGSGDGSRRNQQFMLSKPPLTYVSSAGGTASTLEVRVNDVLWSEVPSLYGASPSDTVYVVRIDDDARARVTFGDGVFGARPASGTANITARYRSGIGADGEVEAGSLTILRTMPLGVRSVTNALPAGGAEDPEKLADARHNAPLTVLTFDRVVSLPDFEDFARTFPGIGKALGDVLWIDDASVVHVTVAGATGGAANADVVANLIDAIGGASDGSLRFLATTYAQRFFNCRASVAVDERYSVDLVLAAVVERIQSAFSFEARQLAQPVTPAEVSSVIHGVDGVLAVDLDELAVYTDDTTTTPSGPVPLNPLVAERASWDSATRQARPAHLLLVNPAGIEITEMVV